MVYCAYSPTKDDAVNSSPPALTPFQKFLLVVLRPRKQWLPDPRNPKKLVLVVRTWVGRLVKPRGSAVSWETYWVDSPTLWPPLLRR